MVEQLPQNYQTAWKEAMLIMNNQTNAFSLNDNVSTSNHTDRQNKLGTFSLVGITELLSTEQRRYIGGEYMKTSFGVAFPTRGGDLFADFSHNPLLAALHGNRSLTDCGAHRLAAIYYCH